MNIMTQHSMAVNLYNIYFVTCIIISLRFLPRFAFSFIIPAPVSLNYPTSSNNINKSISSLFKIYSFSSLSSNHNDQSNDNNNHNNNGIRLNKVFKATHSRREADKLISSGRVTVNGVKVNSKGGFFVIPYVDTITLDGVVINNWEDMNAIEKESNAILSNKYKYNTSNNNVNMTKKSKNEITLTKSHFEYIKFYKPVGVTCTTDLKIKDNIIHSIHRFGYKSPHRIYPVGRLDKDTSGLILLTSDGRLPNAVLKGSNKQPKVYEVEVDIPITDTDIQRLQNGIIITTVAQRDNAAKKLTQRTKPCTVKRLGSKVVQMTLMEGRNRQIRKMMGALGFTVVKLHRTQFMNININTGCIRKQQPKNGMSQTKNKDSNNDVVLESGLLQPGDWAFLDANEMSLVEEALRSSVLNGSG